MPDSLLFSGQQTRNFDRPLHQVSVNTGSVVVTNRIKPEETHVVNAGETLKLDDVSAYSLYSPDSASVDVTYLHEAQATPAVRGDEHPEDDKETGSYESRPKDSLYELGKERGLDVNSSMKKDELIAVLRGE